MRATSLAIHQLEQNSPLSASEESLISSVFKPEFVPQIQCWALTKSPPHRRKFFSFLAGTPAPSRPARVVTSLSGQRPDFVLNGPACQINLGLSFNPRPVSRQMNRERFASPGITGHGIFREDAPPARAAAPREEETLATFMVRNLMNATAVPRFRPLANANFKLLQELTQWIERRNTNPFPLDALIAHPTLSPVREFTANRVKNREDHIAAQLPHIGQSGPSPRKSAWRTPSTAYSAFFNDEERFAERYWSGPLPPFEQSQPFCKFPQERGVVRPRISSDVQNPVFVQAAAEDSRTGRRYRHIFQSTTCL
jgi:hypothetical protein